MKLLIDAALNYLELLLINKENKIVDTFFVMQNKNLTNLLIPCVDKFLNKNNISKESISDLLVVNGPGSFTSIKLVSVFSNSWKMFYPFVRLKYINSCLWNSTSNNSINVIDAKSGFYYVNINLDNHSNNKVDLIKKETFDSMNYSCFKINYINQIQNPYNKWEFNKNNFIETNKIVPNYVKPAI